MKYYGYIYKTTNLINGKIYVGQKKGKFDPNYYGSGKILKQAVDKYGEDSFIVEVIERCKTWERLQEREIYWIKKLKSRDRGVGYNITIGGQGCHIIYSELPEEEREYYHKIQIETHPAGWHHTEETKKYLSKKAKGKPKSKKHKKSLSNYMKNNIHDGRWDNFLYKPKDKKYRKKISDTVKELYKDPNSVYNSEEYREKLRKSSTGRHWYNNGKENKFTYKCPKGFKPGFIKYKQTKKKNKNKGK